ncbi:MAG: hypothetical protein HZB42_04440 [Sphingobacteriales bacterium]|nr:hypothetical protein [Sphingobacteriales bacterium]
MSSGIQHKLLTYEVTPPSGVWNKITDELDDSELDHEFPAILRSAEINPPATLWNKIQIAMNAGKEATVSKQKRIPLLLRYATAAIVTGLVAWGGIQLLNSKQAKKDIVVNEDLPASIENTTSTPELIPEKATANNNNPVNTADAEEARNDAALEASKKTFAKLDISTAGNKRLKNIASAYRFAIAGDAGMDPQTHTQAEACTSDNTDRYIVIITPEGNIVRMSKKLSHLICCVSAEEEDKDCKEQMSKWRSKIASATTSHSTGSFFDILSMVSSLQDQ